jgi:hypothetical protein
MLRGAFLVACRATSPRAYRHWRARGGVTPVWAPPSIRLIVGYAFVARGFAKLSRSPETFAVVLPSFAYLDQHPHRRRNAAKSRLPFLSLHDVMPVLASF